MTQNLLREVAGAMSILPTLMLPRREKKELKNPYFLADGYIVDGDMFLMISSRSYSLDPWYIDNGVSWESYFQSGNCQQAEELALKQCGGGWLAMIILRYDLDVRKRNQSPATFDSIVSNCSHNLNPIYQAGSGCNFTA